jgi:hypothetical protein
MKPDDDLGVFKDWEQVAEDSLGEFWAGIWAGVFLVVCILGSLLI